MRKKTIKEVYDDTFKQNYYMLIGASRKKYVEIVKKELKIDVELPSENVSGRTQWLTVGDITIVLIWTLTKKPCHVAHECFHAIDDILRHRGVVLSDESCEIYAYSLERLIRSALS